MPLPEHLEAIRAKVSNWGRWGADDERGTLNFLTSDVTRAATASNTPTKATAPTTTTRTTTQPRARRRGPASGSTSATGTPAAGPPPRAGLSGPDTSATPPGAAGSGTAGPSACSRASVLLIALRHPSLQSVCR